MILLEIPCTIVLRISGCAGVLVQCDCTVCCCGFCYWVPANNYPLNIFKIGIISDWIQNSFDLNSCHLPAGTQRNNAFTTSTRRRRCRVDVVKTLSLRHYCVMCPLGQEEDNAQRICVWLIPISLHNSILQYYDKVLIIGTFFIITLSCDNWSVSRQSLCPQESFPLHFYQFSKFSIVKLETCSLCNTKYLVMPHMWKIVLKYLIGTLENSVHIS